MKKYYATITIHAFDDEDEDSYVVCENMFMEDTPAEFDCEGNVINVEEFEDWLKETGSIN